MNITTKKTLEAVLVGGVLVVSLNSAYAASACDTGTMSTIATSAGSFVKTQFTPKCSANTVVDVLDSGATFTVQGASRKGNQVYGGSTEGGGVTMCSTFGAVFPSIAATASTGC